MPNFIGDAYRDSQPSGSELGQVVRPLNDPAEASRLSAINEWMVPGRAGLAYSLTAVTGSAVNVAVSQPGRYLITFIGGAANTLAMISVSATASVAAFPTAVASSGTRVGIMRCDVGQEIVLVPSGSLNIQVRLSGTGPSYPTLISFIGSGSRNAEFGSFDV